MSRYLGLATHSCSRKQVVAQAGWGWTYTSHSLGHALLPTTHQQAKLGCASTRVAHGLCLTGWRCERHSIAGEGLYGTTAQVAMEGSHHHEPASASGEARCELRSRSNSIRGSEFHPTPDPAPPDTCDGPGGALLACTILPVCPVSHTNPPQTIKWGCLGEIGRLSCPPLRMLASSWEWSPPQLINIYTNFYM